jgi:hypothetical protein
VLAAAAAAAPAGGVQQHVRLLRAQQQQQQQQGESSNAADSASAHWFATPYAPDGDDADNRAPSKRRSRSLMVLMTGREAPMSQLQGQQLLALQRAAMQGQAQAFWRLMRQRQKQRQLQQGAASTREGAHAEG